MKHYLFFPILLFFNLRTFSSANDLIILKDYSKVYGNIKNETKTKVTLNKDNKDTDFNLKEIKEIIYTSENFKPIGKIVRMGQGFAIKRNGQNIDAESGFNLVKDDILFSGNNGISILLFKNNAQIILQKNSELKIESSSAKKNDNWLNSVLLNEGTIYCSFPRDNPVRITSENAIVEGDGKIFSISFNKETSRTSVNIHKGLLQVQSTFSTSGEIILTNDEKLIVLTDKKKIMQEELSQSEILALQDIYDLISLRYVTTVHSPEKVKIRSPAPVQPTVMPWQLKRDFNLIFGGAYTLGITKARIVSDFGSEEGIGLKYLNGFHFFGGAKYKNHSLSFLYDWQSSSGYRSAVNVEIFGFGGVYFYSLYKMQIDYISLSLQPGLALGYWKYTVKERYSWYDNIFFPTFFSPKLKFEATGVQFISVFAEYSILQPIPWEKRSENNSSKYILTNFATLQFGGNFNF